MNDCIPKPFTPEDLYRALVKHAPTTSRTGGMLVDLSYLQRVSGSNETFMSEMVTTFLNTIPKSIIEIRSNVDSRDWQALARSIHKIKPSLSLMGLSQARETAARIEHDARDWDRRIAGEINGNRERQARAGRVEPDSGQPQAIEEWVRYRGIT